MSAGDAFCQAHPDRSRLRSRKTSQENAPMTHVSGIPPLLLEFLITTLFSFLIGLEFRTYQRTYHGDRRTEAGEKIDFGSTRTFTFIGAMGFVLYALDPTGLLFGLGLLVVAALLWIYYWRQAAQGHFSLLVIMLPLLTYLIGPVTTHFPEWFLILFVVVVTLILSEKPRIRQLSDMFNAREITTLAKFLIISGIILPLLPDRQIAAFITVTYYQVWLAVIVVSSISYLSYLAQTYVFKAPNLLFTGMLGGLYSSTAASVVIGRQARIANETSLVSPALIMATTMMYLRLWALVTILGHTATALHLLGPFAAFVLVSTAVAFGLYRKGQRAQGPAREGSAIGHPLELPTALLFAFMFVLFAFVTHYVLGHYGDSGLQLLAFIVGLTDIDPFILSLLAGKFQAPETAITAAVLIASGSNNLLKAAYAVVLGRNRSVIPAALWLVVLFGASVVYAYWLL
jgi:uncharacterized membrane protein (DUF4010 family)